MKEEIRKYTSHSGITIEIGDFYGGGIDESVLSLEDDNIHLRIKTTQDVYLIPLQVGDFLGLPSGSGKIIKNQHEENVF